MKHQVSKSALRLTAITTIVLLLVGIAGHFIQAAGSPSSTNTTAGLLRQPIANGNGLVAWWKLDSDASDSSGNNNTGVLNNFTYDSKTNGWTKGEFGNGLLFNGKNNYVSVATTPLSTANNFTASIWIDPYAWAVGSYAEIFGLNGSGAWNFQLSTSGVLIVNELGACVYSTGYTFPSKNRWYNLTYTVNAGVSQMYVNGQATVNSSTCVPLVTSSGASFGFNGSNYFNGVMDDARIYNRALSASEITNLYQGSSPANFDQFTKNYYPLDDNLGDAAVTRLHQTATSNNGTLTNSPTWATGQYGNALSFNGTNQYVSIPDSSGIDPTSQITLSAWIKPSSASPGGNKTIINKRRNSIGNNSYSLQTNASGTSWQISWATTGSATALNCVQGITANWTHLVGTYDGTTVKLYINGSLDASASLTGTFLYTTDPLEIGSYYLGGGNFPGFIDDVRIYNTALSSTDVADLYNGKSLASQRSNLVGYWDFDEGTGTTAYDHANDNSALLAPGGSTWTSGNFGSAISLTAASYGSLSIPDEGMTLGSVEFWINPSTITGDQRLISQASGASTQAGQLALNQSSGESGSLWVWDGTAWQRLADTGTIGAGVWNHIVVDYSGASATAFVNGVQTYTVTTALAFSGVPLSFGGLFLNTTGGYFNGLVDDLRFSSRIIQDYEAADHYRLGV